MWAAPGRDSATVRKFFDALGEERSALLTHVSADGAEWIHTAVTERAPPAILGMDEVRRGVWNELRWAGRRGQAASLKGSR